LANQFATAINAAQAQGYNQNGTAGTALFTVPSTVSGSAALITFATSDPTQIAASSDGSSGSTGNVANLSAVATTALGSGYSPTDTVSNLVYQVGSLTSNASADSTAIGTSLAQLTQQQSSVSGVSTDEESANLIRYQQSYQAAAQIVNTVSALFTATINMLSSAG
jgi:flagellar hook-associated protein 1 FlgK